jgi:phosphoserine phosphatase RsbU/P
VITHLRVRTPDNQVRRVSLEGQTLTVGRAHTNDLCYPDDASLSRQHMVFEHDGDGWSVTDLKSKNGTLVNGVRIGRLTRLSPGDQIAVGGLQIVCLDAEQEAPESVIFVPETGAGLPGTGTIMASLEGLLSGEATGSPALKPGRAETDSAFQSQVVRILIRAGRELAGHQPLEELFRLILDLSIEAVGAERGVLMTLEGERLVPRAVHGEGLRISTTVRDRVLQRKDSLLVRDRGVEEALLKQESISGQQIHSLIAVPLQTDDQVIGLVYVDSRMFVREFTPDDLNLLTVLANVAAIRIDHERHLALQQSEQRRTRDLEQAADIQRGILPKGPPVLAGFDLAGHNAPCRTVGGDYYDFISYPDGRLCLVLGDVAGKGMAAALMMSSLQARVQLLTEEVLPLSTLMSRLDHAIASRCPANRFITLFVCLIDPQTGALTYCNAGHNPALLVRASGEVIWLSAVGTVLGILPELGYEERQERLEPGDLLAIYSDGLTEAATPAEEEVGQDRLAEWVVTRRNQPAASIVAELTQAVHEWCAPGSAEDDMTLLIARRLA